jgi:hypothetical protein
MKSTNCNDKSNAKTWTFHMDALRNVTTSNTKVDVQGKQQPHFITDKSKALAMMMEQNNETNSTTKSSDDAIPVAVSYIWYRLDVHLQCDYDIAMAAVQAKCIPTNILLWPVELRHNIKFWDALLLHQRDILEGTHNDTENQRQCCIPVWTSETQIRSMLSYHPTLRSNVSFWYTVLHCNFLTIKLSEMAHPTLVLGNKNFMIHAIEKNFKIYRVVKTPLNQDVDIVTTALQQSATVIYYMPTFIQDMYPNAVIEAVKNFKNLDKKDWYINQIWRTNISEQYWSNRNFICAWACSHLGSFPHEIPFEYRNDEDLFLLFAEHRPHAFEYASTALCSNKKFMTKAIEICGEIFYYAKNQLRYDFELATIAFAQKGIAYFYESRMYHDTIDSEFRQSYLEYITMKLFDFESHYQFVQVICHMIQCHNDKSILLSNQSNPLVLLIQDEATTIELVTNIQEYVGSPTGVEYERLHLVWHNIEINKYHLCKARNTVTTTNRNFNAFFDDDDDDDL